MRVWTCVDHDLYWPVGGASVIVAETMEEAGSLLSEALYLKGLKTDGYTLQELDLSVAQAVILDDGNY